MNEEPKSVDIPQDQWWKPLYYFLNTIFGDKYKEAADSFMYMGAYELTSGTVIYEYKHGVTRKYIALGETGAPYKYDNTYIPTSYDEVMQRVYGDIEKFYGVDKKNKYFLSYSDYMEIRDKKLDELGYNSVSVDPNDDKDIRNKISKIKK